MTSQSPEPSVRSPKAATGIAGFDEMTAGGLPYGRNTLLSGGRGSGKTIFSMRFLAHGILACNEPGIFVTFEEQSKRIVANFEGLGTDIGPLSPDKLFFLDAQPAQDHARVGAFDLGGLVAALEVQTKEMHARRIVFDALDVVLALLPDAAARRREIHRLHAWLIAQELTGLITSKTSGDPSRTSEEEPIAFMQSMVDCSVILDHAMTSGVSRRNVRIRKYRGSSFAENETPLDAEEAR